MSKSWRSGLKWLGKMHKIMELDVMTACLLRLVNLDSGLMTCIMRINDLIVMGSLLKNFLPCWGPWQFVPVGHDGRHGSPSQLHILSFSCFFLSVYFWMWCRLPYTWNTLKKSKFCSTIQLRFYENMEINLN